MITITENNFKDMIIVAAIIGLFILAFLVLKSVILSIAWGGLLAYIFYPIYKWTVKKIKNKNSSAVLMCILLVLIILVPAIIILNSLISQAINFYLILQNLDLLKLFKNIFPSSITSLTFSETFAKSLSSFIPNALSYFIDQASEFALNIPIILLQFFIVIFVFFFALRDGEKVINYIKSLSPFTKDIEDKFLNQFKDVTNSVLFGQIVAGVVQGAVAGVGYFVVGVPYALLLTILTMFFAIIPFVGAWTIWVPIDIYLFASGRTGAGIGLLIYGLLIVSLIDNFMRIIIVSKRTKISTAVIIVGMIGGLFVFGILGLVLGPLILSYVILIVDLYRPKEAK